MRWSQINFHDDLFRWLPAISKNMAKKCHTTFFSPQFYTQKFYWLDFSWILKFVLDLVTFYFLNIYTYLNFVCKFEMETNFWFLKKSHYLWNREIFWASSLPPSFILTWANRKLLQVVPVILRLRLDSNCNFFKFSFLSQMKDSVAFWMLAVIKKYAVYLVA